MKWPIDSLRYYLLGWHFFLETPHWVLQWLHRMKDANMRIAGWYLSLQLNNNFMLRYKSGRSNMVADCLSRGEEDWGAVMTDRRLFLIEKMIYLFCDCLAWRPCTVSWWESCDQQCVAPLDREGSVSNLSFEESGSGLLNSSDQKESTELGWGGTYHHWSSTLHPGWFSKAFLRCHQITSLDSSADLLHGLRRLYQWSRCSCQQNFHNTFFGWGFSCL